METYAFLECTPQKLDKWFGLQRTLSSQVLDQWLQTESDLTEVEQIILQRLKQLAIENVDTWNEQELVINFIGPLFGLVNFSKFYAFNFFSQRNIEAVMTGIHTDIKLSGEPDGIVATGYWEPEIPMFAFSEYKRQIDPNGDPAGQCLAAMLVGQELNKKQHPLYGCYVVGETWRFLVLEGREYTISPFYSTTSDEIADVLRILKTLKQMIVAMIA